MKTYFIADIAANHDGDIERAKHLCLLAKQSGADAVKFQHHDCKKYVSDFGFKNQGTSEMKPADPSLQNRRRQATVLVNPVTIEIS